MPTTKNQTIKLLSSGASVRRLQKSLIKSGAKISASELNRGVFGRSTQTALRKFQTNKKITATGIADQKTLALLNPVTVEDKLRQGNFSSISSSITFRRAMRTIESLDLSQAIFNSATGKIPQALKTWKQGKLTQQLIASFDNPSENLVDAIKALPIDIDKIATAQFSSLIVNDVLPQLLKDKKLETEIYNFVQSDANNDPESESDGNSVAEVLALESDIRDVPELQPFVNTIRNTVFSDIVRLGKVATKAIGDANLLETGAALTQLENQGILKEQQRKSLLFVVDLARLTDDNFKAIRALVKEGISESRALVSRNTTDWVQFIKKNKLTPPKNETPESYAKILDQGVEKAFPTAYMLSRHSLPAPSNIVKALPLLDDFPTSSETIFVNAEVRKNLDLTHVSSRKRKAVGKNLKRLSQFANRYTGLGVPEVLNNQDLSAKQKLNLINRRIAALSKVWELHPNLDLQLANFLPSSDQASEAFRVDIAAVSSKDQPFVRRQLMSMQRVFQLSDSFADVDKLMAVGLDSAVKIAEIDDEDELIRKTGLRQRVARSIQNRASLVRTHMVHFVHSLEETEGHALFNPKILGEYTPASNTDFVNVLKDLPGYSELFGPQNYCKCRHCQSIFSPAAYFVDLMGFIHKKISQPNFIKQDLEDHSLYLKNRREDLWNLPLTCDNTNNTVIYLSIVNEVLENYLAAHTSINGDVFEFLANEASSSFKQPFNLPYAELLLYLEHLGVELKEVSALYAENQKPAVHSLLGISPQVLNTLSSIETNTVHTRFAIPDNSNLSKHNTAILVKVTGVDREMLERLWSTEFVTGNIEWAVKISSEDDDLVGFTEHLHLTVPSGTNADDGHKHFLERLHRFTRLQKALDWTPEEVQLVINALRSLSKLTINTAPEIYSVVLNAELLANIAEFKQIKEALGLTVSEAIALCHQIPQTSITPDKPSLWFQLFRDKTQLEIRHPKLNNTTDNDSTVTSDFGVLQGALRLAEPELIALLNREISAATIASGILVDNDLYRLYRFARLAQALDLSLEQLLGVLRIVPAFADAEDTAPVRLAAISQIVQWLNQVEPLALSLGKILDILGDETNDTYSEQAEQLVTEVQITLNEEEKLWLTPKDFSSIEGISPEASRAIIVELVNREPPWLLHPEPTTERYLITDAVTEEPDFLAIQEALLVPGAPLAKIKDIETDHSALFFSEAIAAALSSHHPAIFIRQAISAALSISGEYEQAFASQLSHLPSLFNTDSNLTGWIQDIDAPNPEPVNEYASEVMRLTQLYKDSLGFKPADIEFISQNQPLFSLVPGQRWQWSELFKAASLQSFSKKGEEKFSAYQRALFAWSDLSFADSANEDLAIIFDINALQVESLLSEIPQNDDPFVTLQRLTEAVRLSNRTGLDPASLRQLTSITFDGISAAAELLLGAMRIKYPNEDVWKTVETPFLEKQAGLKRDALVDRILSRTELQFDNARDIYHFFLLDPEMGDCYLTSRVKNAITSCQLYVQRCLMGLEQQEKNNNNASFHVTVKGSNKTREEWKWRKSYRIWEANRKVFLYPENYMLPDLRDDRSHIFKTAEQDLLQGKLDNSTIDQVFKRYIAEFVQVGDLEIVHILYERTRGLRNRSSGQNPYLLFGRTKKEPFRYFMREYDGRKYWQPWQPIELDISARTISAVRKKGKLYLFWTNVALNSDADKIMDARPSVSISSNGEEQSMLAPAPHGVEERVPISIIYSSLDEAGNWSSPQDILYYSLLLNKNNEPVNKLLSISDRIYAEYPHPNRGSGGVKDFIRVIHPVNKILDSSGRGLRQYLGFLRESDNKTVKENGADTEFRKRPDDMGNRNQFKTPGFQLRNNRIEHTSQYITESTADVDDLINNLSYQFFQVQSDDGGGSGSGSGGSGIILEFKNVDNKNIFLRTVQQNTGESVLDIGSIHQYLIKKTGRPGGGYFDDNPQTFLEMLVVLNNAKRKLVSLGSTWPEFLSQEIYSKGVTGLLSYNSQIREVPRSSNNIDYRYLGEIRPIDEDFSFPLQHRLAQFEGAHGDYLWEVFFHLPIMIAHTFNSQGKFEEADRWYRYVFDPTTAADKPKEHWRFVVFRSLKIPKLRHILTQTSAINAYKNDPFNPYAIARLRPSAFEKNIVMRYIDNLLDWGDEHFRRDTRESTNEALLLYIMAADLLGERPIETGECEVADSMTYNSILLCNTGGEFLVELENSMAFIIKQSSLPLIDPDPSLFKLVPIALPENEPEPLTTFELGEGFQLINTTDFNFAPFSTTRATIAVNLLADTGADTTPSGSDPFMPASDPLFEPEFPYASADVVDKSDPEGSIQLARTLGFCVPPNGTLLGYWDRVEDRLYKLRHCMNIDGVERQLPLWQPPIDPMLLVRAKAAGLELDDVIKSLNEQPPFQRFDVLLERARRFTSTTQQLGNQLLSALERKDENELVLLRSVHEDEILSLSRTQKNESIDEANKARGHLDKLGATIELRKNYYVDLLGGDADLKMNAEELDALTQMDDAKESQGRAAIEESQAQSNRESGSQWSAGLSGAAGIQAPLSGTPPSPLFARASADASASWGSFNEEAGYNRRALNHRDTSAKHSALAGMASIRGGHQRRIVEWQFQQSIAQSEIDALVPQKAAADIRVALAEKELEIHDAQIKNSRELYDFAKDRFTGLGLYTYLSTSLSRLHREAYDMAYKMAQVTERAYRFELGEDKTFIKMDNWNSSRAGLLSGDKLLLQLQAMEASFVEKDKRRQEITLPCSLAQIDPQELMRLRQTGGAEFTVPEWWFNLYYPGQYRRLLQAVRLTIPCITGPYNNVAAKLTLLDSWVRKTPSINDNALFGVQIGRNSSISTSTANADPGVFELRFDAPKNPPFKGAGAESRWQLQLPENNRVFDYSTISDVVLELSYTADDDGLFRQTVEGINGQPGSLDIQLEQGLTRIISLRHEFPTEFQRLKSQDPQLSNSIILLITRRLLLPNWVGNRPLVAMIDVALEPKPDQHISASDIQTDTTITLNNDVLSSWFDWIDLGTDSGGVPMVASENEFEIGEELLELPLEVSFPDDLEFNDILIRVNYRSA